jgi:hypothetical protein
MTVDSPPGMMMPSKFMRSDGSPKYSPWGGDDKGFDFKKMKSPEHWESVWRSYRDLDSTPETKDAFDTSVNLIRKLKDKDGPFPGKTNPVSNLYRSIERFVGGREGTLESNEEIGKRRELLYAINNAPTQNVPELHRGMRLGQEDLDKLTVGSNIDYDVSSWSADPTIARAFAEKPAGSSAKDTNRVILHLPSQSKALQIAGASNDFNSSVQEEWLSARDSHEITDRKVDEDGVHHIYLKQKGVGMDMDEDDNGELKRQKEWQQDWISDAREAQEPTPKLTPEQIKELGKNLRR